MQSLEFRPASPSVLSVATRWFSGFVVAALMVACGGGGDNAPDPNPAAQAAQSTIRLLREPAYPVGQCANVGYTVQSGIDTSRDGNLDPSEVTYTSNRICSAGLELPWVDASGPSVQAESNKVYLANGGASTVTVTLPAAPVVGDVIDVVGVGLGGWTVVANPGQWMNSFFLNIPLYKGLIGRVSGSQQQSVGLKYMGNGLFTIVVLPELNPLSAALPVGYVTQGGLIWTPASAARTHEEAVAMCDGMASGPIEWRLPTEQELTGLRDSRAMITLGWFVDRTWSATPGVWVDLLEFPGRTKSGTDADPMSKRLVTCVH